MTGFEWNSLLSGPLWGIMALIPPAILALYFLKLKREPMQVPSTFLWHKAIEDLHVNSLWQRLRRSLLLLLQLLIIFLAILALLNPTWQGQQLPGDRYIFLVDNSASMSATDIEPTRLDSAKQQTANLIEQMQPGSAAMIISFSDVARVEQNFTTNRQELLRRLEAIKPTARTTEIREALLFAAGLANPGRTSTDAGDVQIADALEAELFILSDGKLPAVDDFNLGNLRPTFITIGNPTAANVAIAAFNTRRKENAPDQLEAFARLHNYGTAEAEVVVELWKDDQLIDASQETLGPDQGSGVVFPLEDLEEGVLELRADTGDDLALDDIAWATINRPRSAEVLLVTPGNQPLEFSLTTELSQEIADVIIESPDYLKSDAYSNLASSGAFDLVIYDRCSPEAMPQANTLFIGAMPPLETWKTGESVDVPVIIDTDQSHPIMQLIELGDVDIVEGRPLEVPAGGTVLIETQAGPMLVIAPREGYEDAVLAFRLLTDEGIDTNWPLRLSFPLFVMNTLKYMGTTHERSFGNQPRPGQSVTLEGSPGSNEITVRTPEQESIRVRRSNLGVFNFSGTNDLGVYEVEESDDALGQFAVNLFDAAESNIRPPVENSVSIGHVEVAGQSFPQIARTEGWRWLLLAGLVILIVEWYIYNRRVYL